MSLTCFGRQIPSTVVNLPTRFCDDRTKGVEVMANHFYAPPTAKIHGSLVAMLLPVWLIYRRNLSFHTRKLNSIFGVDRVNLSKALFILFFLSCKKSVIAAFVVQKAFL